MNPPRTAVTLNRQALSILVTLPSTQEMIAYLAAKAGQTLHNSQMSRARQHVTLASPDTP